MMENETHPECAVCDKHIPLKKFRAHLLGHLLLLRDYDLMYKKNPRVARAALMLLLLFVATVVIGMQIIIHFSVT